MKDWKSIALANGLPASEETDRIAESLRALEETFRPLVSNLPADLEPATILEFREEGE